MLEIKQEPKETVFVISKKWDKFSVVDYENKSFDTDKPCVVFDFSNLSSIDMAAIRFFLSLEHNFTQNGKTVKFQGLDEKNQALFKLCKKYYKAYSIDSKSKKSENFFVLLGSSVCAYTSSLKDFITFTGFVLFALYKSCLDFRKIRFKAFLYHVEHSALNASGIIALTSLLVGVVLAYQAAYQLGRFGANIFIVDLVGISATREIAPLIAAIVIAGRSASSYTAQIGVMKISDEINAMRTMGFHPIYFVVLPRVLALTFSMPLIVAFADAVSIFGGMLVADLNLGINYVEFIRRFKEAIDVKHIIIGIAKAPMFGFLIGLIACYRGLGVKNTTESIGIYTTKSVVNAIFWVIAFDAIFSIFLTQAGI